MLKPRSIAVVGASSKGGYGGRLFNAVVKAKERVKIYPVNPNYDEIGGVKAYRSITELPEAPDLVGIVVPYSRVLDVLQECHDKGAGAGVIISAGFAERGTDSGLELQRKVAAFTKQTHFRFTGPNCLGLANVRENIWATASSRTLGGLTGHIALVCQSGATAFGPFLVRAVDSGIGLSHIISTGNEIDLDFSDFARYLIDDPDTRVIAGFVEGFKDVRKFIAVAELAGERGKPIVLIKIGRSESGAQAARSHTAALTGSDSLYEALFAQYGVIRVRDYDELLEVSHLLANTRKPLKRGVAVVSHSGGISSLTADMLGEAQLELPALTPRARDGINTILKDFGWAANPADVTGFARRDEFVQIMNYLIEEPEVGALVIASAGAGNQIDHVIELRERTDKNVAFFWTASRNDTATLPKLKASNIPIFYSPVNLARGLKSLLDYHEWRARRASHAGAQGLSLEERQQQAVSAVLAAHAQGSRISERESKEIIAQWGIAAAREATATTAAEAVDAADRLGYPVVVKVDSRDIPHKTEAGAVRVGLRNAEEVRSAFDEIIRNARNYASNAAIDGVLVQEMVTGGIEVIVGVKSDAQLGPMLLFGSGGVHVEVYDDVILRHCPIDMAGALEMISHTKGVKLLGGFRGKPPADIEALADALVRVSHFAVAVSEPLAELDLNPLMVLPRGQGVKAVDALLVLKDR
jgi:acetyltransferase